MRSGAGFSLAAAADLEAVVAASGRGQCRDLGHRRHVGGQNFRRSGRRHTSLKKAKKQLKKPLAKGSNPHSL